MKKKYLIIIVPWSLALFLAGLIILSYISNLTNWSHIPSTLEEAYLVLDELLSDEEKDFIKNFDWYDLFYDENWRDNVDEDWFYLWQMTGHMGLGLWIRNNWIHQSAVSGSLVPTNIAMRFLLRGIGHPDDMSSEILEGYRMYLNGLPYSIPIRPGAIVTYAVIAILLTSSLLLIIIDRHRK